MRRSLIVAGLIITLTACKDRGANSVKFSPPVVKADVEITDAKLTPPPIGEGYFSEPTATTRYNVSQRYDSAYSDANSSVSDTSKKIVKDGTIQFETGDLLASRKRILNALKKYGGYVDGDNQSINSDSNRKEYELKIRVPAKYFDFLLDTVSCTADKIETKNIIITDVTTRFIDISTRLRNKKTLEKRYLELLSKANKISDLLAIESKLNDIRSDIESTQGQLNYLSKQVAFSSLDITFYTKLSAQINSSPGFTYKLTQAVARGWHRLQSLFFGLIGLWPYLLLIGIAYLVIKKWLKLRKIKRAQTNQ
jgi:hypothetical protein